MIEKEIRYKLADELISFFCEAELQHFTAKFAIFDEDSLDGEEFINVIEYWLISDWLADKVEDERGQVVVRDYHGLTIWGRRTEGPMNQDPVIQAIHKKLT